MSEHHRTRAELEAGLADVEAAPVDDGRVEMIVRRPAVEEREVVESAVLDLTVGLVGDTWSSRPSTSTDDGSPHPDAQLTLMSSRVAALVAGPRERWTLAGDQLIVDLDLSEENLPPGTRLRVGSAVVEVTAKPHTGCKKYGARFGAEALRFINVGSGKALRMRGVNARVVEAGEVRTGAAVAKLR